MKPIIVELNENGNVELAKEKLQEMLDEAYEEGKKDGSLSIPYIPTNPVINPPATWKDYVTCSSSTLKIKSDSPSEDGRWGD